jgi:hypothetical protein
LCAVVDVQDFYSLLDGAIDDDVGKVRQDEFPGAFSNSNRILRLMLIASIRTAMNSDYNEIRPAGRARYARCGHFVTCIPFMGG